MSILGGVLLGWRRLRFSDDRFLALGVVFSVAELCQLMTADDGLR
jgi:hypothetical protein